MSDIATVPAKAPPGTYWRGPVLWGRVMVRGHEHRFSLQTADPAEAIVRRNDEKRRLVDSAYFGKAGLTDKHAKTAWRRGVRARVAGFIYFVEAGDHIKIGYAKDWQSRIASLQTGHHQTLRVIGAVAGNISDEQALHRRFRYLRSRGEWFRKSHDLLDYIARATKLGRYIDEGDE